MELKDYEKWCEENGKDPMDEGTLKEFKKVVEKQQADEAKAKQEQEVDLEKLTVCIDAIAKYVGVRYHFNCPDIAEQVHNHLVAMIYAAKMTEQMKKVSDMMDEALEKAKHN